MSQQSVASLPEHLQSAKMHETDRATQDYPPKLVRSCLLHVCQMDDDWEVWLNCEDLTFTGMCIGVGETRDEAVADAVAQLEATLDALQQPPA